MLWRPVAVFVVTGQRFVVINGRAAKVDPFSVVLVHDTFANDDISRADIGVNDTFGMDIFKSARKFHNQIAFLFICDVALLQYFPEALTSF